MANLEDDRNPVKKKVGIEGFSKWRTTETEPQAHTETLSGVKKPPKVNPNNKKPASYST